MKTTFFALTLVAAAGAVFAQTATSDDPTNSGAKVGTGAEAGITTPENVGPRTGPANSAGGLITTPPPEITPEPPSVPNAGTGAGSATNPVPPGAGAATNGAGTGR